MHPFWCQLHHSSSTLCKVISWPSVPRLRYVRYGVNNVAHLLMSCDIGYHTLQYAPVCLSGLSECSGFDARCRLPLNILPQWIIQILQVSIWFNFGRSSVGIHAWPLDRRRYQTNFGLSRRGRSLRTSIFLEERCFATLGNHKLGRRARIR